MVHLGSKTAICTKEFFYFLTNQHNHCLKHFKMTDVIILSNINRTGNAHIEVHLCNHCCSGKAISITYFECVSVNLGIQHAMCMHHIVISGLSGSTVFFHIISLTAGFLKKMLLTINCVF